MTTPQPISRETFINDADIIAVDFRWLTRTAVPGSAAENPTG